MVGYRRSESSEDRHLRENKRREHKGDYTGAIKHYVRKQAWVPAAQNRLQKVQTLGRKYLRYFTLCAEEAIDVRIFKAENLIQFDGRGYPDVVFCECDASTYEQIAANLGHTEGIRAYFDDLLLDQHNRSSEIFYSKLSDLPFDVYNLDFTSVCFPIGEPPFSKTLEAIITLINVLGRLPSRQGFDIFLTFRAQKSEENKDAIDQLKGNVHDNKGKYPWFGDAFVERYRDIGQLLARKYHEFLLV